MSGQLRPRTGELVPLTERMGWLQATRLGFGAAVVVAALAAPWILHVDPLNLGAATLGYLAVTALVEAFRRTGRVPAMWVVGGMLLADGVYLAWAMYATGGSASPLRFLPVIHLIAVTLVGSYRTGLKIALWHSLMFFVIYYAQVGNILTAVDTSSTAEFGNAATWLITGFWLTAFVTAAFSSLNERELRRRRSDLEALAEMSTEMDKAQGPGAIAKVLLDSVCGAFGFERGVVLAAEESPPVPLATAGTARVRPVAGTDEVVDRAWRERRSLLIRRLDPQEDRHLNRLLPTARNLVVVPLIAEGHPVGAIVLEHPNRRGPRIERRVVAALEQFGSHGALALRNAWLLETVQTMAQTDPLTGLANRRAFRDQLERDLARAERARQPVTLLMLDLDYFKGLNDTYGHQAGDDVLRDVGKALLDVCRASDVPARYGGEEFAVIMPGCSSREALVAAERMREAIANVEAPAAVTASVGAATFPTHAADIDSLIRTADEALYEAKRQGRDRSVRSRRRAARSYGSAAARVSAL